MASGMEFQKLLFRGLGALVSLLFALQATWFFLHPPTTSFWRICHWVGQAFLCLFVGAAGFYLELKGGRALVEEQLVKFAANRLLLTLFYFWLGCYVMDIAHYGRWQESLARATGFMAWAVSAGDVVVSCACGGKEGGASRDSSRAASRSKIPGAPALSQVPPGPPAATIPPSEPDPEMGPAKNLAPAGGWNTSWTNAYGASS